jgi:hypothetical protein
MKKAKVKLKLKATTVRVLQDAEVRVLEGTDLVRGAGRITSLRAPTCECTIVGPTCG